MEKYSIIITYNGLRYDIPYLSARLLKYHNEPIKRHLHIDCCRLAKKIFQRTLRGKYIKLVHICSFLGIKEKGFVDPEIWERMKYAAEAEKGKCLKKISAHCKDDVVSLEKAFDMCFRHAIVSISLA